MLVGNTLNYGLESKISQVYDNLSLRGLGYFVIYIKSIRYGVYNDEATALGCSFNNIEERIAMRGKHIAPFSKEKNPELIANSVKQAIYADNPKDKYFFGLSINEFTDTIYNNKIIWAPDGDEAFDDGSYILHFDIVNKVRLIGFRCLNEYKCDIETLSDILVDANDFYSILNKWYELFISDWKTKVAEL